MIDLTPIQYCLENICHRKRWQIFSFVPILPRCGIRQFSGIDGGFVGHKTYTCSPYMFKRRLSCGELPTFFSGAYHIPNSRFSHTTITGSGMITCRFSISISSFLTSARFTMLTLADEPSWYFCKISCVVNSL